MPPKTAFAPLARPVIRRGMTIVEIVSVIGIIIVLLAILLPALSIVSANARWATSQSNMRQIFQLMHDYSSANREFIVPSAFDYSQSTYPGKARSQHPPGAPSPLGAEGARLNHGTWSDILWAYGDFGPPPAAGVLTTGDVAPYSYLYDSPDRVYYNGNKSYSSIFRSTVPMTKAPGGTEALPFGSGAQNVEIGQPGYFAGNQFFDSRSDSAVNQFGDWRTTAEIKRPEKMVYLVDSWHGELIEPTAYGFGSPSGLSTGGGTSSEGQVDFRYPGNTCLMLFIDGHNQTEGNWDLFEDLGNIRNIEVDSL